MPNFEIDKEEFESLDPAVQELYTASGDSYIASGITGALGPKAQKKLKDEAAKYRTQGNEITKELAGLKAVLGDRSPDDVQAALDEIEELRLKAEDAGADFDEKLAKRVEARLKAVTTPLERQLEELAASKSELEQAVGKYQQIETKREILSEFRKSAKSTDAIPEAYQDDSGALCMLATAIFEKVDGQIVTKEGCGLPAGMPPDVAIHDLKKAHGYLWAASQGSGASGSGGAGGAGSNPFDKATFNLTEQGRIRREDPILAAKLQKQAK